MSFSILDLNQQLLKRQKKAYSGGIAGKASSAKYCYSVGTVGGGGGICIILRQFLSL